MAGLPAQWRRALTAHARRAAAVLFSSPLYALTLLDRRGPAIRFAPVDPWPGDPVLGEALASGRPGAAIADDFAGLRDLRALGGDEARLAARRLTQDWMARNRRWSMPAWRGDILSRRIFSWLTHYDTFFASGEDSFRRALSRALAAQLCHLDRVLTLETVGAARIAALKGLVCGALGFGRDDMLDRALARLHREIEEQILPDGGHVERNPALMLAVLRDLVEIRAALAGGQREVPEPIQQAIDRMGPMLRYLRHGDGRLAHFNGSGGGDAAEIEAVLDQASPRGRAASRAPATGFERLAAGGTLILADAGSPPPPPFDQGAHAGALSFEMSVGRDRMIVNCGAGGGAPAWRQAQRATAAHSTAVVNERNSSEVLAGGNLGHRRAIVKSDRDAAEGAVLINMVHDGYARSDGIVHRRRLYLAAGGDDLRGEDSLSSRAGIPFRLRFHLHPSVTASILQNGRSVLLRLPRGGGWRLRCTQPVTLEESVYFENGAKPKRTLQIVVPGLTNGGETTVKWAFRRETRRG